MVQRFLIVLLMCLGPQLVFGLDGICKEFKGSAFVRRAGKKINLSKGLKILESDTVVTGPGSFALIEFQDHSTHKVGENSSLDINELNEDGFFTLLKGSIISLVVPKKKIDKKKHFRIKTRSSVAGVRGTQFVSYGTKEKKDDVWVCVHEGEVEVSHLTSQSTQQVKAGEGVSIFSKTKKVSKPKALAWTKKINWNMNPVKGEIENSISIDDAYKNLLDVDYD